jgi:hypothetical protein
MQKFQFSLECALQYRQAQFEMQQAQLEALFSELHDLENQQQTLTTQRDSEDRAVKSQSSAIALSLVALDAFNRHAGMQKTQIELRRVNCLNRIREQQERVILARRNRELLERMRGKRKAEWLVAERKEIEDLASELHLARWSREQRA